jgi:hypothetical protein
MKREAGRHVEHCQGEADSVLSQPRAGPENLLGCIYPRDRLIGLDKLFDDTP